MSSITESEFALISVILVIISSIIMYILLTHHLSALYYCIISIFLILFTNLSPLFSIWLNTPLFTEFITLLHTHHLYCIITKLLPDFFIPFSYYIPVYPYLCIIPISLTTPISTCLLLLRSRDSLLTYMITVLHDWR